MDHRLYSTSQFAQKASVSVRTLRYYDNVGLLSPSRSMEAGYRQYTDSDFSRLQQILALKFLGFSLEEIRLCLQIGPTMLQESLTLQKAMMQDKRQQLETIIAAIDETEKLLQANTQDWQAIVKVIRVIQMQQTNDWRKNHFTDEHLKKMEELSKSAYTEEQRARLAELSKNFTEADQRVISQRWEATTAELKRLVSTGQDPAGAEAQALAKQWTGLIHEFTQGDEGIAKGLAKWYKGLGEMPAEERPFPSPSKEGVAFIGKALEVYRQNHGQS